jgi:hypothetical protein
MPQEHTHGPACGAAHTHVNECFSVSQIIEAVLPELSASAAEVHSWLAAQHNSQQLEASGYSTTALLRQLRSLHAVSLLTAATASAPKDSAARPAESSSSNCASLCEQLCAAGTALTAFAIPNACNNPTCANVSGPSEAQIVGSRSCVCAGDLIARYCSKACQKKHWRVHKSVCKALAAAAAAARSAASGD